MNKDLIPALQLDVMSAIEKSSFNHLKNKEREFESSLNNANLLTQYEPTLFGGDKTNGQRILSRNTTAQCLRCHAIQGHGGAVGPPLDGIGTKLSRAELLESLVDPNARIAPGYGTVILKLKDGKELAGILMEETRNDLQIKLVMPPSKPLIKKRFKKEKICLLECLIWARY